MISRRCFGTGLVIFLSGCTNFKNKTKSCSGQHTLQIVNNSDYTYNANIRIVKLPVSEVVFNEVRVIGENGRLDLSHLLRQGDEYRIELEVDESVASFIIDENTVCVLIQSNRKIDVSFKDSE